MKTFLIFVAVFYVFSIGTFVYGCKGPAKKSKIFSEEIGHNKGPCTDIRSEVDVEKLLADHLGSHTKVQFFASWCASCMKKLQSLNDSSHESEKVIVVGVFDKRSKINRVVSKLKIASNCFYDEEELLAKKLNVKSVPALRVLN